MAKRNSILTPGQLAKLHPEEFVLGGSKEYINPIRRLSKKSKEEAQTIPAFMDNDAVRQYLQMSGQSWRELLGGEHDHGLLFILNELVPEASRRKRKIVWRNFKDRVDGTMYSFRELSKKQKQVLEKKSSA